MKDALFSSLVERAIRMASVAHVNQRRKHTDIPYLSHLMHVAMILVKAGFDDEIILSAAILHDVVEDTSFCQEDIENEFPEEVANLVDILTEISEDEDGNRLPWQTRKENHIDEIREAPPEARAILLADKLHNLRTMQMDQEGNREFWERFNAPSQQVLWYYRTIVETASEGQSDCHRLLADECLDVLEELESGLED